MTGKSQAKRGKKRKAAEADGSAGEALADSSLDLEGAILELLNKARFEILGVQ